MLQNRASHQGFNAEYSNNEPEVGRIGYVGNVSRNSPNEIIAAVVLLVGWTFRVHTKDSGDFIGWIYTPISCFRYYNFINISRSPSRGERLEVFEFREFRRLLSIFCVSVRVGATEKRWSNSSDKTITQHKIYKNVSWRFSFCGKKI